MSSFWWNFHHWLHWKLSKWQLPVQPVMKISSKWRHFRFSVRAWMSHCIPFICACMCNYLSMSKTQCWSNCIDQSPLAKLDLMSQTYETTRCGIQNAGLVSVIWRVAYSWGFSAEYSRGFCTRCPGLVAWLDVACLNVGEGVHVFLQKHNVDICIFLIKMKIELSQMSHFNVNDIGSRFTCRIT